MKAGERIKGENKSKPISVFEMRIWGAIFVIVILIFSVLIVKMEAKYYDIHKENQLIEGDIAQKEEIVSELEVIENELSSPKRILKIAKEQGLEYHEDNLITVE